MPIADAYCPRHALEEISVALFSSPQSRKAGIADLVLFEEATTREVCDWMIDFMQGLGLRYLRWPTRLRRRWVLMGRKRLECFDGEQWKDIYRDFDRDVCRSIAPVRRPVLRPSGRSDARILLRAAR
jgi:hypothetical protein